MNSWYFIVQTRKLNMKIKTKYDRWSWLLNINFSVIHPVMTNQCEVWWPFSLEKTENWSQILPDFKIWLLFSGQMFGIMIKKFGFNDFIFLRLDAKPFNRDNKYSRIKRNLQYTCRVSHTCYLTVKSHWQSEI